MTEPSGSRANPYSLTAAEYLVLDVLAARRQLGESRWVFPWPVLAAATRLEQLGLAEWRLGTIEGTLVVSLTPAGVQLVTPPRWTDPLSGE